MAEDKKSFILYKDLKNKLKRLSREDKGALLEAILAYVNDEELPDDMPLSAEVAFDFIQPQLDSDNEAWEQKKEARAEAGRKGGKKNLLKQSEAKPDLLKQSEAKPDLLKQSEAKPDLLKQSEAKQAVNVTVTGNVTGNVNKNPLYPPCEEYGSITGFPDVDKMLADFASQRELYKRPMTPAGMECLVADLKKASDGDRQKMLDLLSRAIAGGWSNIYPDSSITRGKAPPGKAEYSDESFLAYIAGSDE